MLWDWPGGRGKIKWGCIKLIHIYFLKFYRAVLRGLDTLRELNSLSRCIPEPALLLTLAKINGHLIEIDVAMSF